MIKITKIDVAKRELEEAIKLFFQKDDPIIVHLIGKSSNEILRDLCKHHKIRSFIDDIEQNVIRSRVNEVKGVLKSAYNFIKHADRDPKKTIDFNPDSNQYVLWDNIDMYSKLTGDVTGMMQAYRMWFYTTNHDLLMENKDKSLFKEISKTVDVSNTNSFIRLAEWLELRKFLNKTNI